MSKVNLELDNLENREARLGSIVSWDGKASELSRLSQLQNEERRCGGRGKTGGACRLRELNMPFNQQTMCANGIVACQIGNLTDSVLIEHSPIGCSADHPRFDLGFKMGLARRNKPIKSINIFSTNLLERDMVFGAGDKLRQSIRDAFERYEPKAIFISMSCSTAIIGEDIGAVAAELEKEIGIPVVPLYCEGFRSNHWSTGFDISQHGIVRQISEKNPKRQPDLINIVALWGTDYFTDMLKPLGLRVNYIVDMASFEELRQTSEAAATATFCHTLGSYMATALEEQYGIPQIKGPQPYGIKGTDAWLRAVGETFGKTKEVEKYIKEQHKKWLPEIEKLREKLKQATPDGVVRGFVSTGSSFAHAMIEVIRDLGVEVKGSIVFHHDPTYDSDYPEQETLQHLIDASGDIDYFTVSKTQQFQFAGLLKRVNPDFIVIRHNGLAPVAAKLGIPSFAMGDEHFPLGYEGIVRTGNALLDILARKKFNNVLKRHIKLPYTEWWLNQPDQFVLAKHPEILDEEYDAERRKAEKRKKPADKNVAVKEIKDNGEK
jgi:nitrogenase molybdenum-iron protein alpha chain